MIMNDSHQELSRKNTLIPILIIAGLFFVVGFITWINGALIPFMKTINELTDSQSYIVVSASYISFVFMALPASYIINKIGYKKGMSLGLIIMAVGALLFIPAARARTYWIFLIGIFVQGAGMTLLQTASNPYITILGPLKSAAKRIAIMGIANKVAGALGSVIFGAILLSGIDETKNKLSLVDSIEKDRLLNTMSDSVITPYIIMAVVLFILGGMIRKAPLPNMTAAPIKETKEGDSIKKSIFHFPHLWLGVLALFVYVGVEVIAGDTIISYGISLDIPVNQAKFFTLFTLMAMVGTYILGVFLIPKYIRQETALKISAILGLVLSVCIITTNGFSSVLFVSALGIANALVWPAIWPLALKGLGKFTKTASALLVMAISGGAIIPPLYGAIVDHKKEQLIADGLGDILAISEASTSGYWILLPCYFIILFYAFWGYNIGVGKK